MAFSDLPWGHYVLMLFSWTSFILYIHCLRAIMNKKNTLFRKPFFHMFMLNSITDISMFLFVEFCSRVRKFGLLPIYKPLDDSLLVQTIYFTQTFIKTLMYFGSLTTAFNRFAAVYWPFKQGEIWTKKNINFVYIAEVVLAFYIQAFIFYTNDYKFSFVDKGRGLLSMRVDSAFFIIDAIQDMAISSICCITATILYILAFLTFQKMNRSASTWELEKSVLKCAFLAFIPYIPNALKSITLLVASYMNNAYFSTLATDSWYYTTEIMCLFTPWALVLSSKAIRKMLWPSESEIHRYPIFVSQTTQSL